MFEVLKHTFPMILGLAFSLAPILSVVMLLMTPNALRNTFSFFFGWISGILLVGTLIFLLPGIATEHGGISKNTGIAKIALGLILFLMIIPVWIKRPKGESKSVPTFLSKVDEFGLWKSFTVGFVLSGVNIKNVALTASAATYIYVKGGFTVIENYTELLLFSLLSSLTIILPLFAYSLNPKYFSKIIIRFKFWLIEKQTVILICTLIVFGLVLIYNGGVILN